MIYDFNRLVDRRNTNSIKWNVEENELPMWVADMDFLTLPEITTALEERIKHGIYGYPTVPKEWRMAYRNWWLLHHKVEIKEEWLHFGLGVNLIIARLIEYLTDPGDSVVMLSPTYNAFYHLIRGNRREVLESQLIYDKTGPVYSIDFSDLEKKLSSPGVKCLIFCNPHNPIGRIWSREELRAVADLCLKYDILLITDEIHCDITDPKKEYVPILSLDGEIREHVIVAISPTKTFNLAGLQTSAVVVVNEELRKRVIASLKTAELDVPNVLSTIAAVTAFTRGWDWLLQLRQYIFENKQTVGKYLKEKLPQVLLTKSEATYLLWLDCSCCGIRSGELAERLRKDTGLFISSGEMYGTGGESFIRMNIACPRERLMDGLKRFDKGIRNIIS